ncbi:RNA-binding S4 domain-containing protein [Photobacterium damselae]|uniref:RNA-binding S4 domain-containing protein n=1 Tax=Photobacterium damselae TaxID=38293 RepID=UPI0010FD70BD|nr:RNA-binding S4 domain-containing protein [Photobacterium damselae]NVH50076.1 RNA-binding S4 domain-containing protein [Photobacterium damselae subsp. damselae]NVO79928.1 RNA-binding S4 domain-containing protein [Photobacterium damselae subsp. damselae]TLS79107.1 urease [Photobacterium damselae subsp. damselae]TLS87159.1 urease [Photobacterium damselae subsp. damselae]
MCEEIEVEALEIVVSAQPIELYKVLKIANLVSGGGEAKYAISEGYVAVNGEIEQRKRCKMYDGDVIEFNGEFYVVLCDQPVQEPVEKTVTDVKPMAKKAPKPAEKKKTANHKSKSAGNRSVTKKSAGGKPDSTTGRKPISF